MPNTFFRFKQFTVHQDKTAMKVCTDACLFGAWVSDRFEGKNIRIADIGAGTGLLSLMLAQKVAGKVDAIEVDEDAFEQATSNFSESPWRERVRAHHAAVQDFSVVHRYDLVVSNPPFYKHDLRSADEKRNVALHGSRLGFDELLVAARRLLADNGFCAFLIPFEKEKVFEQTLSERGFSIVEKVLVRQTVNHSFFRVMYLVKNGFSQPIVSEFAIKDAANIYTAEFNRLLADYYL